MNRVVVLIHFKKNTVAEDYEFSLSDIEVHPQDSMSQIELTNVTIDKQLGSGNFGQVCVSW